MAAGIVPVCPYHRKPSSVCSGGFFGSQGGGASGARRVAGRSGFRSADSHCGVFRTGRPNNCRCNSSPHATSVRPTRRADMRARPLICHRHTAGREWHASISPAGGLRCVYASKPLLRFYPPERRTPAIPAARRSVPCTSNGSTTNHYESKKIRDHVTGKRIFRYMDAPHHGAARSNRTTPEAAQSAGVSDAGERRETSSTTTTCAGCCT